MRISRLNFLLIIPLVFSCSPWETVQRDYYPPVMKSEVLVIDGDTLDIIAQGNFKDHLDLSDSALCIQTRFRFGVAVWGGIPSLGETRNWTDTSGVVMFCTYNSIKFTHYSISITQIPFNCDTVGPAPEVKHELVDSIAFRIECNWDGNNKYTAQVHARKYVTYVVD